MILTAGDYRRQCPVMSLMRAIVVLFLCLSPAGAQSGWGNLDALLFPALTDSGTAEMSYWLPNAATPEEATEAVGVVYEHVPGSAGSTSIEIGIFRKSGSGFALAGRVEGIFGHDPREVAYHPDRIEFTTTTLNEGDPRCCPTGSSRWAIDRETLAVRQVR